MKSRFIVTLLTLLILQLSPYEVYSQSQEANNSEVQGENYQKEPRRLADPSSGSSTKVGWFSSFEFGISISVLIFGLLVFALEYAFIKSATFEPEQTIKLIAVTLIVISTLFIITAGFDSEQIAPAMGLFGTIAGYMLGRANNKEGAKEEIK